MNLENSYLDKFEIDNQTLLLGDSLKIMPEIKEKYDACITDPPYNISGYDNKKQIGWLKSNKYWTEDKKFSKIEEDWDKFSNGDYLHFTENWLKMIFSVVKENGNIIIFGTYHNIYKIGYLLELFDKRIVNSIVWYKRNAFPNITQRMLCESTEYMIWAVNNSSKNAKKWTFNYDTLKEINDGKQMRNMWDIPMTPKREKIYGKHPAQKPMAIAERLIHGFTNVNDSIIDPFMGSGTIPLACMSNNRKCLGIDNNNSYYELAKNRLIGSCNTKSLNNFED